MLGIVYRMAKMTNVLVAKMTNTLVATEAVAKVTNRSSSSNTLFVYASNNVKSFAGPPLPTLTCIIFNFPIFDLTVVLPMLV